MVGVRPGVNFLEVNRLLCRDRHCLGLSQPLNVPSLSMACHKYHDILKTQTCSCVETVLTVVFASAFVFSAPKPDSFLPADFAPSDAASILSSPVIFCILLSFPAIFCGAGWCDLASFLNTFFSACSRTCSFDGSIGVGDFFFDLRPSEETPSTKTTLRL